LMNLTSKFNGAVPAALLVQTELCSRKSVC
jgi:hypothetical protein